MSCRLHFTGKSWHRTVLTPPFASRWLRGRGLHTWIMVQQPPRLSLKRLNQEPTLDNCKKPPMTRHGLCFLLDTIYQVNQGAEVDISCWGYPEEQIKEGYSYLISFAFMTSFSWEAIKKELKDCTVTKRGEQLIARENKESKGKTSFKAHVTAKANVGVAGVEIGAEVSHEKVG